MMISGDQLAVQWPSQQPMDKGSVADNDRCARAAAKQAGFYSRVLMSKWVAARAKVKAVAGDDSDQTGRISTRGADFR